MAKHRREATEEETIEVQGKLASGKNVHITAVTMADRSEEEQPARFTMKMDAYYEQFGYDPWQISIGFCAECEVHEDEEPYEKRIPVAEEWTLLDCGWVEEVGLIFVTHLKPMYKNKQTDEVIQQDKDRRLQIRFGDTGEPHLELGPGMGFPIAAVDPNAIYLRMVGEGKCKAAVAVLPR